MSAGALDPLSALSPEWVSWLCEALHSGAPTAEVEASLAEEGHPDPRALIATLRAHPLYEWARRQRARAARAESYAHLQGALWTARPAPARLPRLTAPTAERLFDDFYLCGRPVVIEGWASRWPAVDPSSGRAWSAARLEALGPVPVRVCEGREGRPDFDRRFDDLSRPTTLDALARRVMSAGITNDFYLIARNYALDEPALAALLDDIDEAPYLDPQRRRGSLALWFGPAGTLTPLHHDTCNILFVQVWGEKTITLAPPHALELLDHATHMYSDLDPQRDLAAHPVCAGQVSVRLRAGEALLIPVGWWHHVYAHTPSISLAMTHLRAPNSFDWYRPGGAQLSGAPARPPRPAHG